VIPAEPKRNKYRDLAAAQPGWYLAEGYEMPPFYKLTPIACWAVVDEVRAADDDSGVVALIVNEELHTLTEPLYDPIELGIYHESQLTEAVRANLSEMGKRAAAEENGITVEKLLARVEADVKV
jgi:hypothetical protein